MEVCIDGLRINLARSFNDLFHSFDFESLDQDQVEAFEYVRQNIAFLLLTHDQSIGMEELNPDQYLATIFSDED